jgi:LacI family transcriptional regulator
MPTIHDVAKRAGVAPITVSRVINNSGYVSKETRERVETAIAELEYVPNVIARSLRSKRTNTLALVLTDITNPFFTVIARGVEDTASQAGMTVIYCNTDESEVEEEKYLQLLLQKQVDGILLVPACSVSRSVDFIQEQGTPVVILDRKIQGVEVDSVRGDSEGGAYQLVKLLLDLGHTHIAALSGPADVSTAEDRVIGYRRALEEADLLDNELVYFDAFTQASGFEMAHKALLQSPRPTALFAANNFIAYGALKALREAGLDVPAAISMVAFDDLPEGLVADPILTVAAQPAYEMGQMATELLLNRLRSEVQQPCQEIILPTELIVRSSSGPFERQTERLDH